MRTMTVLSILSETTTPWRTLRCPRPASEPASPAPAPVRVRFSRSLIPRPRRSARTRRPSRPPDATGAPRREAREARSPSPLFGPQPRDELGLDRQLVGGAQHRLAGDGLRDPGELEHHPARLDHGDPRLRVALSGPHPGLGG